MDWQTVVSLAIVGLAAVVLARHLWAISRGSDSGACGGCTKCSQSEQRPLITLKVASKQSTPDSD